MDAAKDFSATEAVLAGRSGRLVDLPALFGDRLVRLPMVLRLLLENVVRCMQGTERDDAVAALLAWLDSGSSEAEIEFQPGRVLMHDTTSTPALVDIAAMRDALAEAGVDPSRLNPVLPVDVSVDHSLAVEAYAQRDAAALNLTHEMRRNRERYAFLRWASKALQGVHINPPGTGIMHTINLEQLATVVTIGVWLSVPIIMSGTNQAAPSRCSVVCRCTGLWFDPQAKPRYTRSIEVDLGTVGMHIAGPKRPQDLLHYSQARATLAALGFQRRRPHAFMPRHPIAIAAITSCTNTSDPALLIAAGLVARKARRFGLRVPGWVKTSLGPGSPAAAAYLQRAGLIDDLSAVGFDIVGFGCTTCIGNSGPLPQAIRAAQSEGSIHPVAVLSGNRNFPGRVHPDMDLGFLMSPPLVIAFALAGDAEVDLSQQPIQTDTQGREVHLSDLWPTREQVAAVLSAAADPSDFRREFTIASRNPAWHALEAPRSPRFPWNPASTALRRPPFASVDQGTQLGCYAAYPLLIVSDDITTDHISPASAIPADSLVADFLVERGDEHERNDLNVFASRRGNWEVMMRAAFHSKSLVNLLQPGMPVAHTLHVPSGEVMPIWDVAARYRDTGDSVVLVAGERYGTGSSRDWAAKGQRLLGIRAVLAASFERIHRSNLVGMGILPLRLPQGMGPQSLRLAPGDRIEVDAPPETLSPRCELPVRILRAGGSAEAFVATAAVETQLEVELLRDGGVIPSILKKTIAEEASI